MLQCNVDNMNEHRRKTRQTNSYFFKTSQMKFVINCGWKCRCVASNASRNLKRIITNLTTWIAKVQSGLRRISTPFEHWISKINSFDALKTCTCIYTRYIEKTKLTDKERKKRNSFIWYIIVPICYILYCAIECRDRQNSLSD